jgi:hypothetical protein
MWPIENKATNICQQRLNMANGFKNIMIIKQGMD